MELGIDDQRAQRRRCERSQLLLIGSIVHADRQERPPCPTHKKSASIASLSSKAFVWKREDTEKGTAVSTSWTQLRAGGCVPAFPTTSIPFLWRRLKHGLLGARNDPSSSTRPTINARTQRYHDRRSRVGRAPTIGLAAQSATYSGVVFRIGVPEFACEQREFHELHHHRHRFSWGIVSQTALGCGSDKKGH
jgi:hypothetical protein